MSRTWDVALAAGDLTKIGIGVIVVLAVIGFLLGVLLTAIVARLVILVVVIILGVLVWQQRSSVLDKVDRSTCHLHASFFGIQVNAPDSVRHFCARKTG